MFKALYSTTVMIALLSFSFSTVSLAGSPELVDGLKCEAFGLTVKRPDSFYLKVDKLDRCHGTLRQLSRDDMPKQSEILWWTTLILVSQNPASAESIHIHIEPDLTYFKAIAGNVPLMTIKEHAKMSTEVMQKAGYDTHIKVLKPPANTKFSGLDASTVLVKSLYKNLGDSPERTIVSRKIFIRSGYRLITLEHKYKYGKKPMAKLEDFVKFKPAK